MIDSVNTSGDLTSTSTMPIESFTHAMLCIVLHGVPGMHVALIFLSSPCTRLCVLSTIPFFVSVCFYHEDDDGDDLWTILDVDVVNAMIEHGMDLAESATFIHDDLRQPFW